MKRITRTVISDTVRSNRLLEFFKTLTQKERDIYNIATLLNPALHTSNSLKLGMTCPPCCLEELKLFKELEEKHGLKWTSDITEEERTSAGTQLLNDDEYCHLCNEDGTPYTER